MISGLQENITSEENFTSETVHDRGEITLEHKWEVMVTLSETAMENSVRRPLAEITPCRDSRFARKPHYLRNYAR